MSQREDKNSETTKDTSHRSLLFSLWKKMTGGKGEKGKKGGKGERNRKEEIGKKEERKQA